MSYSAMSFKTVTPDDAVNDPNGPFRGLHCNTSGVATILGDTPNEAVQTLTFVAGLTYPYRVKRVNSTGLTASFVGLQ
jgi:hypothetical protein